MSGAEQEPTLRLLETADGLPFGTARSALVERAVRLAEERGEEQLARHARLELVTSYVHGGERPKELVPFAVLLRDYDSDPARWDPRERYSLLWAFKYVAHTALLFPSVPLPQAEATIEEMQARYLGAGEGLAPVLDARYSLAAHRFGAAAAEEQYLAWVRAPRTHLSDCELCEPTTRIHHLADTGRHEEAVAEALEILPRGGCSEQPHSAIAAVVESLLLAGQAQRAASEHLRGVRLLRADPAPGRRWARHVMLCARSGQLMRGVELLEERLVDLDDPVVAPSERMWLAAAGARLLRGVADGGNPQLPVVRPGGADPVAAVELADTLAGTAVELATAFDTRNGTTAVGDAVRGWLQAEPLPTLPLGRTITGGPGTGRTTVAPLGGSRVDAQPDTGAGDGAPPAEPEPAEPETVEEVAALFEESRRSGVAAQRERALRRWRRLRDSGAAATAEPGTPRAAMVARLEAASLDLLRRDHVKADHEVPGRVAPGPDQLRAAAVALRAAGEMAWAIAEEWAALRLEVEAGAGSTADLLAQLRRAWSGEVASLEPGERCCLAVSAMVIARGLPGEPDDAAVTDQLLAWLSRDGVAVAERAGPALTSPRHRACAALLLAEDAGAGEPTERVPRLRAALAMVPAGTRVLERALIGHTLGRALIADGDAAAESVLAEVARDAIAGGEPMLAVEALTGRAEALRRAGRPGEAVDALTDAVELAAGEPMVLPQVRQELVHALLHAGRPLEAAEVAERALGDHLAQLRRRGISEPTPGDRPLEPAVAETEEAAIEAEEVMSCRIAGTLSYAVASASAQLGEGRHAAELARRSAAWHQRIGWGAARAEALALAAETEPDQDAAVGLFTAAAADFDAAGLWQHAARCRRLRVAASLEQAGLPAARDALRAARTALAGCDAEVRASGEFRLEELELAEQAARTLATAGELAEALATLQGVDDGYRAAGDLGSAWGVAVLRCDITGALGPGEPDLEPVRAALAEAGRLGADGHALWLRRQLARLLDAVGRPEEAEAVLRDGDPGAGM